MKPIPTFKMNFFERIGFFMDASTVYLRLLQNLFDEHGDPFGYIFSKRHIFLFRDPAHNRDVLITNNRNISKGEDYTDRHRGMARFLGDGLVTSDGDFWKKQRKRVSPAFHTQRINEYAVSIVDFGQHLIAGWQDEQRLDIAEEMSSVTRRIITHTLFHDVHPDATADVAGALTRMQKLFLKTFLLPDFVAKPLFHFGDSAIRTLDGLVYPIIEQYRAHGEDRGDLLSMLLLTEAEDGSRMTDQQVRDEVVTLLLAGHETTANTLNWTLMLLAQHPHIREALHAELDRVLGGRVVTLADLPHLPYTLQVLKESMRLYPAVPILMRVAKTDLDVGGYRVPAGSIVELSPYFTHRNPNIWDDPLTFDPEHFSPENEAQIDKWAYFPFGGGPRVCVGQSFAIMEAHLLLATIAANYRLELADDQPVSVEASITLYPRHGLPMIAHQRQPVSVHEGH